MHETGDIFADPHGRIAEPRRKRGSGKVKPVDELERLFNLHSLPPHAREFQFAKAQLGRRWAFDFAFLDPYKVAVEVEGLVVYRKGGELVVKGRHASITGFREDCIKYATAAWLGWTVLRFEQSQVKGGDAIEYTMRVLAARGWKRAQ